MESKIESKIEEDTPTVKPCPIDSPICLLKLPGKIMEKNCQGQKNVIYSPVQTLTKLLDYAKQNNEEKSSMDRGDGQFENCYPFDVAWLVVIRDLVHKLEVMKNNENILKEIVESLKNTEPQKNIEENEPFDLNQIFTQILKVGEERFETSVETCNDSLYCDYLKYLKSIIDSNNFKAFSDILIKMSTNPAVLSDVASKVSDVIESSSNDETFKKSIEMVILLLQSSLPIMNKKENIVSTDKNDVLLNFFGVTSPSNGGRKRKKKKHTKRKTHTKRRTQSKTKKRTKKRTKKNIKRNTLSWKNQMKIRGGYRDRDRGLGMAVGFGLFAPVAGWSMLGVWIASMAIYTVIKGSYNVAKKLIQTDAITTFILPMFGDISGRENYEFEVISEKFQKLTQKLIDQIESNLKDVNPDGSLKNPNATRKLQTRLIDLVDRYDETEIDSIMSTWTEKEKQKLGDNYNLNL